MSYATYKEIGVDKNNQEVINYQVPVIQTLEERIEKIKQYPVVVVYYYTDWCGPCKMVAPKFAKLAQNYLQQGVLLVKENAENNLGSYPENIRGVPCFHFTKKDNIFQNIKLLVQVLNKLMKISKNYLIINI